MSNKPLTAAGRLQKRVDELEAKQQRFVAELQAQTARADGLQERLDEAAEAFRCISHWSQEDQDDHDTCMRQWRGCVAIANIFLKDKP